MIFIRHYGSEDLAQVRALHARQGLAYDLPDPEAPTVQVRTVIEEDGLVTNAVLLRKTAEAYWIFDPRAGRKRDKAGRLLMLHREVRGLAHQAGFTDVHCWLPPELVKKFEGTLFHLGWVKPEWTCYHYEVNQDG